MSHHSGSGFQHFIRFSTNAYGLERILRAVQAFVQLLTIYQLPLSTHFYASKSWWDFFTNMSASHSNLDTISTRMTLNRFQGHLGLTRRTIRLFRFFDAFNSAYTIFGSQQTGLSLTAWLDVAAHTFNGSYLFLETITLLDVLSMPGQGPWGEEYAQKIKIESQRSWFLALVAGGLACCVRLYEAHSQKQALLAKPPVKKDNDAKEGKKQQKDKEENQKALEKLQDQTVATGRKLFGNVLDLLIPGTVIGWITAEPGYVALAMFLTSFTTGYDVWKKC